MVVLKYENDAFKPYIQVVHVCKIISIADEGYQLFCINFKSCISRHANFNDILTALRGWRNELLN